MYAYVLKNVPSFTVSINRVLLKESHRIINGMLNSRLGSNGVHHSNSLNSGVLHSNSLSNSLSNGVLHSNSLSNGVLHSNSLSNSLSNGVVALIMGNRTVIKQHLLLVILDMGQHHHHILLNSHKVMVTAVRCHLLVLALIYGNGFG